MRKLVGPSQYEKIDQRDKQIMMRYWEMGIKPVVEYNPKRNGHLTIDLRGVKDNIPQGIEDETITLKPFVLLPRGREEADDLSRKDLNAAVFHPTCEKVQRLVEHQLSGFIDDTRTKALLLVGGFGESNYLYEKLVARFGRMVLKGDKAFVPLPLPSLPSHLATLTSRYQLVRRLPWRNDVGPGTLSKPRQHGENPDDPVPHVEV